MPNGTLKPRKSEISPDNIFLIHDNRKLFLGNTHRFSRKFLSIPLFYLPLHTK